jgi:hypothetical protein
MLAHRRAGRLTVTTCPYGQVRGPARAMQIDGATLSDEHLRQNTYSLAVTGDGGSFNAGWRCGADRADRCRRLAGLMRSASSWLSAAASVLRLLGVLCPATRGAHWRMDPSAARGGIL